jgi:protein dithiol:quinone oxidoreductase
MRRLTPRKLAAAGFLACCGLIAFALYLQMVDHLEPCPLCMMQRIVFGVLGFEFLVLLAHGPKRVGIVVYGAVLALTSLTGLGLASRHVWLQWNPPDINGCTAPLLFQLERFPWLSVVTKALQATGDCARVDWTFLTLSIAQWSWIWFAIFVVTSILIIMRGLMAIGPSKSNFPGPVIASARR